MKPRIFIGSSGKQERLLKSLTSGLASVAEVEPWTTVFNPGTSTLDRLVELTREVDFAAFVFAQDDWTSPTQGDLGMAVPGQASPRDNVVFEAGLFGGSLGMRRTFILHANGAKLPTDLLGLTCVRYDPVLTPDRAQVGQPEGPQGDRGRGPARTHRGALVAVLALRAHRGRALGHQPAACLAQPGRLTRGQGPRMAGRRHPLSALLERGDQNPQETPPGSSTAIGQRKTAARERAAVRGHRRDQAGNRGSSHRLLGRPPRVGPVVPDADLGSLRPGRPRLTWPSSRVTTSDSGQTSSPGGSGTGPAS